MLPFFELAKGLFLYCAIVFAALNLLQVCVTRFEAQIRQIRFFGLCLFVLATTFFLGECAYEALRATTGNPYERYLFIRSRSPGFSYWWLWWMLYVCTISPYLLWLPKIRNYPNRCLLVIGFSLLAIITNDLTPIVIRHWNGEPGKLMPGLW